MFYYLPGLPSALLQVPIMPKPGTISSGGPSASLYGHRAAFHSHVMARITVDKNIYNQGITFSSVTFNGHGRMQLKSMDSEMQYKSINHS